MCLWCTILYIPVTHNSYLFQWRTWRGPHEHNIYIFHSTYVLDMFHSLTSCILLGYTGYLNKRREVRIMSDCDCPKPRPGTLLNTSQQTCTRHWQVPTGPISAVLPYHIWYMPSPLYHIQCDPTCTSRFCARYFWSWSYLFILKYIYLLSTMLVIQPICQLQMYSDASKVFPMTIKSFRCFPMYMSKCR
jgi:hypothetical protein